MPPNTNAQSDQMSQIVERLSSASNVLITVSNNPSVDQLASCIGLTLALNKQGKHATAVFSGKVPSTLEFLQPEKTIETNTNSLRDFIISLDKSKADKLRYKVEDDFVKIFITPYRTSIDEKDLAFSQGDFNIDLIITLGVHERTHLDGAIVAHGRILHDATIVSMTTDKDSEIGTINWTETGASSLCEMASDLLSAIDKNIFDAQIATALLTGMVAETDRFGNEKAHPHTMSVSGVLMAAGASTQLIASKLEEPEEPADEIPAVVDEEPELPSVDEEEAKSTEEEASETPPEPPKNNDGMIQIDHTQEDDILIDEHGKLQAVKELEAAQAALEEEKAAQAAKAQAESAETTPVDAPPAESKMIMEPPQLGGQLTANSVPEYEQYAPSSDPLSGADSGSTLLERPQRHQAQKPANEAGKRPEDQTLSEIEKAVGSIHARSQTDAKTIEELAAEAAAVPPPPPVEDARAAVEQAVDNSDTYRPEPISALGANPVDLNLGHGSPSTTTPPATDDDTTQADPNQDKPQDGPSGAPPPVPPPLMPPGV